MSADSIARAGNLTGALLLAHPSLLDPNFRRSIIFLSHHSAEDGAMGFVLNRAIGEEWEELESWLTHTNLSGVQTCWGGPVATDTLTVALLECQSDNTSVTFQAFAEHADIPTTVNPDHLRVFVGYAGWSRGQLESEIAQKAWIVHPPRRDLINQKSDFQTWKQLFQTMDPALKLLAEAPDDPSLN